MNENVTYIALFRFRDGEQEYFFGDIYPAEGCEVTPERITQLAGTGNRLGKPCIEMIVVPSSAAEPTAEELKAAAEAKAAEEVKAAEEKAAAEAKAVEEQAASADEKAASADEPPEEQKESETPVAPARFQCPHCEKVYAGESWLVNHIKKEHPEEK